MKVSLKQGLLTVALSKPEAKKLADAIELCEQLTVLKPVDEKITSAASEAGDGLKSLVALCSTAEKKDEVQA